MRKPPSWRALVALLVALGLSLAVAGCVSMPGGGPVLPYQATPGADSQNQNYDQIVPHPPQPGESPSEIVAGFLAASASFAGQQQVARKYYLTPEASRRWKPGWSATVYKDGPAVSAGHLAAGGNTASVTVSGSPQATLSSQQGYAVASETPKGKTYRYNLVKGRNGQWRISNAPNTLLLTSTEFGVDYQLADLYFFDPSMRYLVPDPVYVPLQATQGALVNGLVQDLLHQPSDWLGEEEYSTSRATYTAFPEHTALQGAVTVDGGTASVNLTGAGVSRASLTMKEEISAQLLCTLTGACQGQQQQVKSVALYINGKPFVPSDASLDNPVQHQAQYQPPATSQAPGLYYLTATGQLELQAAPGGKSRTIATIGTGYSSLAVSPDGKYLAAVRKGTLYTGTVGDSRLAARGLGSGITSLSWDKGDNLWVVNSAGVFTLSATPGKSAPPPIPVAIGYPNNSCGSNGDEPVALRVAPDGVRVAIVYGGTQDTLAFGAITRSGTAAQPLINIYLSPFFVCKNPGAFTSLSWYGADDVVALGEPGNTVTDYPVNGGTPTQVPGPLGTSTSITASANWGLVVAGRGTLSSATGLSSAWDSQVPGLSPAFPG